MYTLANLTLSCNCFFENLFIHKTRDQSSTKMCVSSNTKSRIFLVQKWKIFLYFLHVVAFLCQKWQFGKKCRASVCSPVPTNTNRILTRRKLADIAAASPERRLLGRGFAIVRCSFFFVKEEDDKKETDVVVQCHIFHLYS